MKKYLVIVSVLLSTAAVYGQQGNFTITVQFPANANVKQDQKVFFILNGKTDSAIVVNGLASFQGQVEKPTQARLMLKSRDPHFMNNGDNKWIYLDQGVTIVTITDIDSAFKATVKGPFLTTEYDAQLRLPVDRYNLQTHLIGMAYYKAKKEQTADTILLKEQEDKSIRACFQVPQTYIKAHPGSSLSIVALNFLGSGSYPMTIGQLDSLYNSLDESVRTSEEGLKYANKLQKLKAVQAAREAKEAAKQKEG